MGNLIVSLGSVAIFLSLQVAGKELGMLADGYVGQLKSEEKAVLRLDVNEKGKVFVFTVDGKKNVALKRDESADFGLETMDIYRMTIPIKMSLQGIPHTEYPGNNLRVLNIGDRGLVQIVEIALISQGGEFFVTQQETYYTRAYQKDGEIVVPKFDRWPQMAGLIKDLLGDFVGTLKDASEYIPDDEDSGEQLVPGIGRVLWYNHAQGFGALATSQGGARVHWSQIKKQGPQFLSSLHPRQFVRYEALHIPVQTKPRPTSFKLEAIGVTTAS